MAYVCTVSIIFNPSKPGAGTVEHPEVAAALLALISERPSALPLGFFLSPHFTASQSKGGHSSSQRSPSTLHPPYISESINLLAE